MGKKNRSEDLESFWKNLRILHQRKVARSMSPVDACVDAARWHGRISVQTARADARLLQDAHNKSSSTYVLPAYVKNHQKKKLEELLKREPKGKRVQDAKAVTNIPRVLRGERSSAEFL